ncbi:hypothetical protein HY212_06600 [Candidatus Pacearchaeota archaeon]|nr:hypothetical protein [Candidatus Pacearchaeota archaeon]
MENKLKMIFIVVFVVGMLSMSMLSAGIGIVSYEGSVMPLEGQEACLIVGAYNPYETGTNVVVSVSDELKDVLVLQDAETKYLPPHTSSKEAIPLKFCFKVPKVYSRQYMIGHVVSKLDCTDQPMKEYKGQVVLESTSVSDSTGGVGGSATKMSVSQPFIVRVKCNPYGWDYTILYVVVAVLSAGMVGFVLFRRYRKPESVRLKEKMAKLKEQMKRSK